jgi:predicted transcriptional regulator
MALEEDGPTDAHRAVLELLALETPPSSRSDLMRLNPESIARSAGYKNSNYIGEICRELRDTELVEREDPGYYSITWRGRAYLEGELSLDEESD